MDDVKQNSGGLKPLVITKLVKIRNEWHGYRTLDEKKERPIKITLMNDSNDLVINGVISQRSLVVNGVLSQCPGCDPFKGDRFSFDTQLTFPCLLKKVQSCNITDLFLFQQTLSWNEYKQLVSSGTVKNLYLACVQIQDENKALIPVEKILQEMPNIEKIRIGLALFDRRIGDNVTIIDLNKETFKILADLPCFNNLREFNLPFIPYNGLDVDSFVVFIKKHPDATFNVSFLVCYDRAEEDKLLIVKQELESRATSEKLEKLNVSYYSDTY